MIKIFSFFLHVVFVDSSLSFNGYLWLFFLIKKKKLNKGLEILFIYLNEHISYIA